MGAFSSSATGREEVRLYRLEDNDRDGDFETTVPSCRFGRTSGEYGPHGMVLGPDGLIYVALGNQTKLTAGV